VTFPWFQDVRGEGGIGREGRSRDPAQDATRLEGRALLSDEQDPAPPEEGRYAPALAGPSSEPSAILMGEH